MIPTKDIVWEMPLCTTRTLIRRSGSICVALTACLIVGGCSNSKLVISPLYNRLDNQIRTEFHKLGDFNDEQTAAFEARLGSFHAWHRRSELPKYASLLDDIADFIAEPGKTGSSDAQRWMETIEEHSRSARQCYPVNFSAGLIQTLSDKQLEFIDQRFRNERRKNLARHSKRTANERVKKRLKNLVKWAGRMELPLNDGQRARLRTALTQQVSLGKQYYRLADRWNKGLFKLARQQEAEHYTALLTAHFGKLWTLMETSYPEQWRSNRELWQQTLFDIEQSLTAKQRASHSRWMRKMARTLMAISKDGTGSFTAENPSLGCVIGASNRS